MSLGRPHIGYTKESRKMVCFFNINQRRHPEPLYTPGIYRLVHEPFCLVGVDTDLLTSSHCEKSKGVKLTAIPTYSPYTWALFTVVLTKHHHHLTVFSIKRSEKNRKALPKRITHRK